MFLHSPGLAQRQHDSLTNPEIDQLRDTALEPDLRLKLYVKFARARLAALEQARADPKTLIAARKPTTACRNSSMFTTR